MSEKLRITFGEAVIAASNLLSLDLGEKNGSIKQDWDESPYSRETFIADKLNDLATAIYQTCNK